MAKEIECTLCGHTAGRHREQRIGTDILGKSCCDCHCTEWRETVERECVEPQADAPMLQFKCPDHGIFEAVGYDNPVFLADTIANCPQCNEKCWQPTDKSDTSLSLLIIDMGDSCVVKVECGRWGGGIPNAQNNTVHSDGVTVYNTPFAAVREAIDSQDKPLPRLELQERGIYHLAADSDIDFDVQIGQDHYDALCEIAGHPLPIWTGGKWERLPSTAEYIGDLLESVGIKVYRYTR